MLVCDENAKNPKACTFSTKKVVCAIAKMNGKAADIRSQIFSNPINVRINVPSVVECHATAPLHHRRTTLYHPHHSHHSHHHHHHHHPHRSHTLKPKSGDYDALDLFMLSGRVLNFWIRTGLCTRTTADDTDDAPKESTDLMDVMGAATTAAASSAAVVGSVNRPNGPNGPNGLNGLNGYERGRNSSSLQTACDSVKFSLFKTLNPTWRRIDNDVRSSLERLVTAGLMHQGSDPQVGMAVLPLSWQA